jgi:glucosamine-6-phosphate deaminase
MCDAAEICGQKAIKGERTLKEFKRDNLEVKEYADRDEMGKDAALDAAAVIKALIAKKSEISMIFAAAPSQDEFLKYLSEDEEIDFSKINAYHMDEYIGLKSDAPQGFGNYLKEHIFGKCPFKSVHYLNGQNPDPEAECARYAALLGKTHIDIVCMGIGENGHIAFNDPANADFSDPKKVKTVKLDEICRQQQVNDGCFDSIDSVPRLAMTLTVPMLMSADWHFCIVPTDRKARAVKRMIDGSISAECPASVLRRAPHATLYIEARSASLL